MARLELVAALRHADKVEGVPRHAVLLARKEVERRRALRAKAFRGGQLMKGGLSQAAGKA